MEREREKKRSGRKRDERKEEKGRKGRTRERKIVWRLTEAAEILYSVHV